MSTGHLALGRPWRPTPVILTRTCQRNHRNLGKRGKFLAIKGKRGSSLDLELPCDLGSSKFIQIRLSQSLHQERHVAAAAVQNEAKALHKRGMIVH